MYRYLPSSMNSHRVRDSAVRVLLFSAIYSLWTATLAPGSQTGLRIGGCNEPRSMNSHGSWLLAIFSIRALSNLYLSFLIRDTWIELTIKAPVRLTIDVPPPSYHRVRYKRTEILKPVHWLLPVSSIALIDTYEKLRFEQDIQEHYRRPRNWLRRLWNKVFNGEIWFACRVSFKERVSSLVMDNFTKTAFTARSVRSENDHFRF